MKEIAKKYFTGKTDKIDHRNGKAECVQYHETFQDATSVRCYAPIARSCYGSKTQGNHFSEQGQLFLIQN